MLIKIVRKKKESYWYNVGEMHNVLPRPVTEQIYEGSRTNYIVSQPIFGRSKGYKMIDVCDCELVSITDSLVIIKVDGQRFKAPGGYIMPKGYAFKHPLFGYLAFPDVPERPYLPTGGREALQEILDAGGLSTYTNIAWVKEMEG